MPGSSPLFNECR